MPKHKKKKKSHKRSKRHSSTSSENTSSPWRVPLLDAGDSDESSNQECLTPLVRRIYTDYLKQALTLNFEDCFKSSHENSSETVQEMVFNWSSLLEQKAMRTCMISELYRSSMVTLIKQIKASTNDKKLFIEDPKFIKLKSKVPLNKESQTERLWNQEVETQTERLGNQEVETQTDLPISSSVELPLPKSSPLDIPYDPAIDFSDSNSSDGGVSSSLGTKQPQSSTILSSSQEVCNISSTSDLIDLARLPTEEDRVKTVHKEDNMCLKSSVSGITDSNLLSAVCLAEPKFGDKIHTQKNSSSNDEIEVGSKKIISLKKRRISFENIQQSRNNLDERLSALGLLAENSEDSLPVEKSKRSNWFAEETAQSCNLTRELMRMTTKKRDRVLNKIKELFGEENGPLIELSEANISICRKRIASVVVCELTPIYQAKKIASRHLFKFLAKKITRSIMEKSLAPDAKSIRWRVKKYFEDGKVIMSESDCI